MSKPRPVSWFALTADTGAVGAPIAGKHAAMLLDTWSRELVVLNPLLNYRGVPYQDNESTGTALNDSGRDLERDGAAALRTSRHTLPLLDSEFTTIADRAAIHQPALGDRAAAGDVVRTGDRPCIGGADHRLAERAPAAGEQSAPGPAADHRHPSHGEEHGLFLLDHNLTIGSAYSGALETLFQRKDFTGLSFESLLKNIVSEKTLATAVKFVKILWSDRHQ